MDDDQQFCLRWNNHQSTLISVFDTLLENGTLVDCTLAAEGKFLKAHKVVLSACSPYFATLLSQQYDKHPIFILKDVKFQELRAMMDYMYRGEVNISQDQLAALLKAAESLQIKGLSDNRSSASSGSSAHQQQQQQNQQQKQSDASASAKTLQPPVPASKASGLTIENKRPLKSELLESDVSGSREGSTSPTRKRKKVRRRSVDTNNLLIDNHDQHSNSSSHSIHTASGAAGAATAGAAVGSATGAAAASAGASSLSSSSAAVGGGAAGGAAAAAGSNAGANVLSAAAVAAAAAIKKTETAQQAAAAELMKLQLQKQQIAAAAAAAAASAQSSDDDERCGGPSSVATGTEHDDGNELTDNEHDGDGGSSIKSGARHHREGRRGNKTSTSTVGDLLIEPKSEYEDGQDENIEDLTMDDEELMDELDQAGPSHGGDVSSQGYAQWPLDREQNEAFIAAQDAVGGQHRDAQDKHAATEEDAQLETQIVKEEEQLTVPSIGKVEPLEDDDGGGGQRNPPEDDDENEDNGDDSDDDEEDYVMSEKSGLARYGTSSSILTTAASLFEESHGALSFVPVGSNHHHQMHPPVPQDTLSDDIALMVGRPDELGYFQCPIGTCDRKYKIKYSLLRHLRNECLADRRYACPKCDKKFCYSFILNRHLLKVHKESPGYY